MSELVSEEALPDWLRQASSDAAQPTQRQPAPGAPTYGTPQGYPPPYAGNGNASGYGNNGGYAPAPSPASVARASFP